MRFNAHQIDAPRGDGGGAMPARALQTRVGRIAVAWAKRVQAGRVRAPSCGTRPAGVRRRAPAAHGRARRPQASTLRSGTHTATRVPVGARAPIANVPPRMRAR